MNLATSSIPVDLKRVVIDHQSFSHSAKRALGLDYVNYRALKHILSMEVGKCALCGGPLCTIHPEAYSRGTSGSLLMHDLVGAGFELLPVSSHEEEDDEAVINAMFTYARESHVRELVLVSSDGRIIDELRYLADTNRHLRVCVVATLTCEYKDRCSLGRKHVELIARKKLPFVDLANFSTRLGSRVIH